MSGTLKIYHSRNSLQTNINKIGIFEYEVEESYAYIYPILEVIDQPGQKVLATIVRVQGSAYKRERFFHAFL